MSQTAQGESKQKTKEDVYFSRLNAQINEERVFKELGAVQMSRIKILNALNKQLLASEKAEEYSNTLEENLKANTSSLVSRYLLGLRNSTEKGNSYLTELLSEFVDCAKWPIVDHISDILLERDESHRFALRAKVESIEHLKGKKESRPYLERLAQIDRKNPEVVKKYALSILEDEPEKALSYLKQAGETCARLKDYSTLEGIWRLIVQHDHKDLAFFERIERIVVGNRERAWISIQYVSLLDPFRSEENWDRVIHILKKVLHYDAQSSRARSDLIRAYRAKYAEHSLLSEFLKMSELTNHKKTVEPCIANFERNIVFDVDNYVHHRTRGVGKIKEIDSEQVIVDFADNPGQRMSIQMAITSLHPVQASHIWVRCYENEEDTKEIFGQELTLFFETLLSSFGNRMTVAEIKHEVTSRFLKLPEWSKWWSRSRQQLKKDPRFGFNPNKKDELILRDTPMTLTEELSIRFQTEADWNKKLEIGFQAIKDSSTEGAALITIQFYKENEVNKDMLKRLHSFFFLEHAQNAMGEEIPNRKLNLRDVQKFVQESTPEQLSKWSQNTQSVELKKNLIGLIINHYENPVEILKGFLFEVPIKLHRYIIGEMIKLGHEKTLISFMEEVFRKYREHTEVFLWIARSLLLGQWDEYEWVKVSREEVMLLVFRLLKPLHVIEKKGTRLKNMAVDTICGTTNITVESLKKYDVLMKLVSEAEQSLLRRMYALFRDVPYIPDAHKENMLGLMQQLHPDFAIDPDAEEESTEKEEESFLPPEGIIFSSSDALEKRRKYLDYLIHVEMPENSKEIGAAQEKGDLRENAEYSAAMERQSRLQAEISSISKELQKVRIIRPVDVKTDMVSIGSCVRLKLNKSDTNEFTILGPWDADTEQNIISYESPLAKAILGKKSGETALMETGKVYEIGAIRSALS